MEDKIAVFLCLLIIYKKSESISFKILNYLFHYLCNTSFDAGVPDGVKTAGAVKKNVSNPI